MAIEREKAEAPPKTADAGMADRIAQAIDAAGGIRDAMRHTGISDTQLRRYVRAEATPSARKLALISAFTGMNVEWFLTGKGRALSDEGESLNLTEKADIVAVPILNIRAAAGAGAVNGDIEFGEAIPLPRTFLRDRGARSGNVQFIRATGDSMSPTIDDGALVLVDRSQREIVDGLIYVVSLGDEVRIKRLHKTLSGKITLRSDGDKSLFPDEELDRADAEAMVVHGRVFWSEKLL